MASYKLLSQKGKGSSKGRLTFNPSLGRRSFLKIAALASALTGTGVGVSMVRKSEAKAKKTPYPGSKLVKTVCT
ncbi:MAG: twin-arginine translocation signal domain-containing protein, partial [Nitrospirae bacterium]